MPTTVVNVRLSEFDAYIGRAGHGQTGYWGNPYDVRKYGKNALPLFEKYFLARVEKDQTFRRLTLELRGKRLGCFCVKADGSGECHGKIIAAWVDGREEGA